MIGNMWATRMAEFKGTLRAIGKKEHKAPIRRVTSMCRGQAEKRSSPPRKQGTEWSIWRVTGQLEPRDSLVLSLSKFLPTSLKISTLTELCTLCSFLDPNRDGEAALSALPRSDSSLCVGWSRSETFAVAELASRMNTRLLNFQAGRYYQKPWYSHM